MFSDNTEPTGNKDLYIPSFSIFSHIFSALQQGKILLSVTVVGLRGWISISAIKECRCNIIATIIIAIIDHRRRHHHQHRVLRGCLRIETFTNKYFKMPLKPYKTYFKSFCTKYGETLVK
jgi:hypothetical protein